MALLGTFFCPFFNHDFCNVSPCLSSFLVFFIFFLSEVLNKNALMNSAYLFFLESRIFLETLYVFFYPIVIFFKVNIGPSCPIYIIFICMGSLIFSSFYLDALTFHHSFNFFCGDFSICRLI